MRKLLFCSLAVGSAVLIGCTPTLPDGPSVAVMPGKNKSFETFQNDNAVCTQFARSQLGVDPRENARANAVAGAATGAALGAAAGAALGDTSRAAGVGAGAGLLMGSAIGNNNAVRSSYELQHRYDVAYQQCMYAKGNQIPRNDYPRYRREVYYAPAYYPEPGYYPSPAYYPPPPPGY